MSHKGVGQKGRGGGVEEQEVRFKEGEEHSQVPASQGRGNLGTGGASDFSLTQAASKQ